MTEERTAAESTWEGTFQAWQEHFCIWLDSLDWSHSQILRWMEGLELPAEDVRAEPHLWLLRALEGSPRRKGAPRLAERVAAVLRNRPDTVNSETRCKILYNLLYLCAGLNRPDELCGPLDWFSTHADLSKLFYRDVPLTTALSAALVWNQNDDRWSKHWHEMIRGDPTPRIPGLPLDGFDAILIGWPRQPATEVGYALAEMAKLIEKTFPVQGERDNAFQQLIERAERRYRKAALEDRDLLTAAIGSSCPRWALKLLPTVSRTLKRLEPSLQQRLFDASVRTLRESGYTSGGAFLDSLRFFELYPNLAAAA